MSKLFINEPNSLCLRHSTVADSYDTRAETVITLFCNDIIFQEAAKAGVPVMDLRLIFNEDSDYANPIEPSAAGGLKMAKIIKEIVYNHDFSLKNTVIFS